jgi:hypothetical protein
MRESEGVKNKDKKIVMVKLILKPSPQIKQVQQQEKGQSAWQKFKTYFSVFVGKSATPLIRELVV